MTTASNTMDASTTAAPAWARSVHVAGRTLILAALAVLGAELGLALQAGAYQPIAAGALWYRLEVSSLNLAQAITQRYLHPALWDPIVATVLQWPAWSCSAAPARRWCSPSRGGGVADADQAQARLGATGERSDPGAHLCRPASAAARAAADGVILAVPAALRMGVRGDAPTREAAAPTSVRVSL